jgi:serine/threonine protein kinase/Tfp pilus assembly protein PilF
MDRSTETQPPLTSPAGRIIGDFRIVRKLGEGGMGVVYEAEQQHPRRAVALKVIRGGVHVSSDVLRLFQREAKTLARLSHPGIASLYAVGVTDDGLHYFAMELIRGATLGDWIRERGMERISPDELRLRLGIFKKICGAVAYAHQRGVIHRDLKPANVLVPRSDSISLEDAVPNVKVLDFGLARITDTEKSTTLVTEVGRVRGTLAYMSPEQIRGNTDEIDQRTDVYALGVVLYELVTGKLPYDLAGAQVVEAARVICEEAPRSLTGTFVGTRRLDLDVITIAEKCLEKEPRRRYQTAAQLGEDVQRFLANQPILARPPSVAYHLRKVAARHKGAVAFAGTVFLLVTALAVTSTYQAFRIASERDRANQEAASAQQVSIFLEGLFKVPDPSESRGSTITAREILDRGAARIDDGLENQPRARARLLATMGNTYAGLGLSGRAEQILERSARAHAEAFGEGSIEHTMALVALDMTGRSPPADRVRSARQALATIEGRLPPTDRRRLLAAYNLGTALVQNEKLEEGCAIFKRGLSEVEAANAAEDPLHVWFLNDSGLCELFEGRLDEARRLLEAALAIREHIYPEDHPDRNVGLLNLADAVSKQGDTRLARELLEKALRNLESVYGQEGMGIATTLTTLAETEVREGRLDEARALMRRVMSILDNGGARRSWNGMLNLVVLGRIELAAGELGAAEAALREAMGIATSLGGPDSAAQLNALNVLADVLDRAGRRDEAEASRRRAEEIRRVTGVTEVPEATVVAPTTRIYESGLR